MVSFNVFIHDNIRSQRNLFDWYLPSLASYILLIQRFLSILKFFLNLQTGWFDIIILELSFESINDWTVYKTQFFIVKDTEDLGYIINL